MVSHLRTLLLWRHAKSAWDDPALVDIARPLAPRGEAAAALMAGWLAQRWRPDAVRCSPARRTVQTWEALAPLLPPATPVTFDARVYEATWPALLSVLRETSSGVQTLLLIGHNPGLEELTAALAEPLPGKFATGALAVLQFAGTWSELAPGAAALVAFQRPKALRRTQT